MKALVHAFALASAMVTFIGTGAQAAQTACERFVACGSYKMEDKDDSGEIVTHQIVIKSQRANQATIEFIGTKGSDQSVLSIRMDFEPDGRFLGTGRSRIGAAGFCSKKMCTYSLTPTENASQGAYGIAGVIRFLPNAVEYNQFVAANSGQHKFSHVYKKE